MAAVGFDDFSGPCGDLALPPLFGGNILESELEQEVEFTDGGLNEEAGEQQALERLRERDRKKYHALQRRCKEIETVNEMLLHRLEYVGKVTQRLKKERRSLMKCLDSHGDSYRTAQLTILLEDEGGRRDERAGSEGQSGPTDGEDPQAPKPRSQGSLSPPPGEGGSGKRKRMKDEREAPPAKRHSSPYYMPGHGQIKQECSVGEMSPRAVTEPLSQVWNTNSPEEKVGYGAYPSPTVYPEFD
uniref:TCF3 fusion partner n=1 Tax=Pristiophorus japonicus TaxID=55135 RepID=UPI00398F67D9